MKELVQFIAKSLVDHPEDVVVTAVDKDHETVYQVKVADTDMGRIIGKQGKVAKALRTVVKAAGMKQGTKAYVDIVE